MIDLTEVYTKDDPTPEYLVTDFILRGQVVVIAGEAGAGKSFLQLHLAHHIALGRPWLGNTVKQGKVLYWDEENSAPDLKMYLRWVWRGIGRPDPATFVHNLRVEHFTLAGLKDRYRHMAEVAKEFAPDLIVIDTCTPVCDVQDENDNSEASGHMKNLRKVMAAAGPQCAMIILKHAKFSHDPHEKTTIRGAKDWLGAADGVIWHKRSKGRPIEGLANTYLIPHKTRAYGLRESIGIGPSWIEADGAKGVKLTRGYKSPDENDGEIS